eukprot:gnl/TRDRNA2_/TRDRNA2_85444_c0_seq1.p1 gnl/TRDRNA2_/TRDRNA2_85444_c0~~gnl/TRDRNA2_/TRDRNA2_85444_c0_seq1.p1  ORF type:complete len:524 (-),score=147.00 gnl/TRDRNA2_/TRDRNA2_85444_c0_seq1:85-1554(-)
MASMQALPPAIANAVLASMPPAVVEMMITGNKPGMAAWMQDKLTSLSPTAALLAPAAAEAAGSMAQKVNKTVTDAVALFGGSVARQLNEPKAASGDMLNNVESFMDGVKGAFTGGIGSGIKGVNEFVSSELNSDVLRLMHDTLYNGHTAAQRSLSILDADLGTWIQKELKDAEATKEHSDVMAKQANVRAMMFAMKWLGRIRMMQSAKARMSRSQTPQSRNQMKEMYLAAFRANATEEGHSPAQVQLDTKQLEELIDAGFLDKADDSPGMNEELAADLPHLVGSGANAKQALDRMQRNILKDQENFTESVKQNAATWLQGLATDVKMNAENVIDAVSGNDAPDVQTPQNQQQPLPPSSIVEEAEEAISLLANSESHAEDAKKIEALLKLHGELRSRIDEKLLAEMRDRRRDQVLQYANEHVEEVREKQGHATEPAAPGGVSQELPVPLQSPMIAADVPQMAAGGLPTLQPMAPMPLKLDGLGTTRDFVS